jgi:membrane protease YdiL (CAAX protease family)
MSRRLVTYLVATFVITWGAWSSLAWLAQSGALAYGQGPFMLLYVLGGFGPTIGAYVAVLATRSQAPLAEYHRRLLRWRVPAGWYLVAVGLPIGLAAVSTGIAVLLSPDLSAAVSIKPWYIFVPLFAMMIIGGGLEELGWRGVAQPEISRLASAATAALWVGLMWALWHLPLFFVPGVSQYGGNFPIFAVGVVGTALTLGWLYSRTESILLCIVFHAAGNAITALGLVVPSGRDWLGLVGPCLSVVVGAALVLTDAARPADRTAARRA